MTASAATLRHPDAGSGGAAANISGAAARAQVEAILRRCATDSAGSLRLRSDVQLGRGPYGQSARADFVIMGQRVQALSLHPFSHRNTPLAPSVNTSEGLALVVVAQHARGSGDQKLPFLVLRCLSFRLPSLIIYDGSGFQPGALTWLRSGCTGIYPTDTSTHPMPVVMSLEEFETWAERNLMPRPGFTSGSATMLNHSPERSHHAEVQEL